MTRINLVNPKELSREHLVAEYREIMRLPKYLTKTLNRKKPFSLDEIPKEYTMGKGHVKFFYNKMKFIRERFLLLVDEMRRRGYTTNFTDPSIFDVDIYWCGGYTPTEEALKINRQRIKERS